MEASRSDLYSVALAVGLGANVTLFRGLAVDSAPDHAMINKGVLYERIGR